MKQWMKQANWCRSSFQKGRSHWSVISKIQYDKINLIESGISEGATLAAGGRIT